MNSDNFIGMQKLKHRLTCRQPRIRLRYGYYEMKNGMNLVGKLIPEAYRTLTECLGWCAKAVDSLGDRIVFSNFENDDFALNEICRLNNPDVLFGSAVTSALIASCSFIYVGIDDEGYPTMQSIDGGSATGVIDPVTYLMTEGYAVLKRDENHKPVLEAYFKPNVTEYYVNGKLDESMTFRHNAPYALLVPVIFRPDAKRPFGHSRISRACMSLQQSAMRTMLRSEVGAEFYSVPQKYILGLSPDAEFNNRAATLSSFLSFTKDGDGDKPTLGQFQQQSTSPTIEQLRAFASLFSGETGLTLDDLGFPSANPSSFDAIRANHEALRLTARKAQRTFGTGFLNAAYLAACIRDDFPYRRSAFANTQPVFEPVFEPDATALAGLADAILKINQALPGFLGKENIRRLTGLNSEAGNE